MEAGSPQRGEISVICILENDTGMPPRIIDPEGRPKLVHDAGNFPYVVDALVRKKYLQEPRNMKEEIYFSVLEGVHGQAIETAILGVAAINPELFDVLIRQSLQREEDYQRRVTRREKMDAHILFGPEEDIESNRRAQEIQEAIANSVALDYIADDIQARRLPISLKNLCF